jgi:hypothetical protein
MKNSGKQYGFSSKSFLILLIFIGGIWLITHSIVSGEFLLKGTTISLSDTPFYFWIVILCFIGVLLYVLKLFFHSLKGD